MICYYVLGMPLALLLAFTAKMDIAGLWLGFAIACIILDVGFAMIISCPNWTNIANNMRAAIEAGKAMMTPEASNYKRNFLNKSRSSHSQGKGGAYQKLPSANSPEFNKVQNLNA